MQNEIPLRQVWRQKMLQPLPASYSTIWYWVKNGKLNAIQRHGKWYVSKAELEEFCQRNQMEVNLPA